MKKGFDIKRIKVCQARKKEAAKICALGRKIKELSASEKARFHKEKDIEEWIKKPKDNIILVAFDEKKFIGFLLAKIMSSQWSMIDSLAVDPAYREQGIGSLILNELFNILEKKEVWYVQAFVRTENIKGRKFWQEKKFKEGKKFIWLERNL